MSSALTVIRQRALFELGVGGVIPNADISAFAATTVTAVRWFQNTNWSADQLQINSTGLFRFGAASAADAYRPAGTLVNTTGVLTQVGSNWSDTTVGTEDVEFAHWGVRLDVEWLKSLNRVTIHDFQTTYLALSHLGNLDGDMQLSTDTNWTDIGTLTTSAKATTAGVTPWGPRSYHTVNNAVADSGTRSASYRVRATGQVSMFTIAASEVGTSSLRPYNNTGSAVFADVAAVTSSEREPQLLAIQGATVPSASKLASLNLTNTSATGDTYWNQAWLYNWDDLYCPLPALISDSFMAPKIIQAVPSMSTGTGAYAAASFQFRELVEGVDYWLVVAPTDAVPYKVRFANATYYNWPLFVEARVPTSSLVTFSAETDVTNGPLERLVPRFKKDLLETVYNIAPRRHPDWVVQHNLATQQLLQAGNSRPLVSVASKPVWAPRVSAP